MNDLAVERRLDEISDRMLGLNRRIGKKASSAIDTLAKGWVCLLMAHNSRNQAEDIDPLTMAQRLYPDQAQKISGCMRDMKGFIAKASTSPAMTSVPNWAGDLAATPNIASTVSLISPQSTYAKLTPRGLRVSFDGSAAVKIPRRATGNEGSLAAAFVGEGQPIPVRALSLASTALTPYAAKVISLFSGELRKRSLPSIEAVLKQCMSEDTAAAIDGLLLSDAAATPVSPAGILNGAVEVTPTAGGGVAALAADLGALAEAVPNASDLVYLMGEAERVKALTLASGLAAVSIITAPSLPARTVVCLDAADLASGESDTPSFDISSEAVVHQEDTAPLPISAGGTLANPVMSLWQVDVFGLRLIVDLSWGMRLAGRVSIVEDVTW